MLDCDYLMRNHFALLRFPRQFRMRSSLGSQLDRVRKFLAILSALLNVDSVYLLAKLIAPVTAVNLSYTEIILFR